MNTFTATLHVGSWSYPLQHFTFGFIQNPGALGPRPAPVMSGDISIVLLNPADEYVRSWGASEDMFCDGSIVIRKSVEEGIYETIEFTKGQCAFLQNEYRGGAHAGTYSSTLQIICQEIKVDGIVHYTAPNM
ncbi:type VI secretion system tube protein TssD [Chitinophagaceae bacterium 26-R-25]|nr:type VI secretion system tube protein TssD [Chitinophagaceae bacterium 26-R-25]